MPSPDLSAHPAVDCLTGDVAIHRSRARTVYLSRLLLDALLNANALGAPIALVTDPDAHITHPLEVALQEAHAGWHTQAEDAATASSVDVRAHNEDIRSRAGTVVFEMLTACAADDVGDHLTAVLTALSEATGVDGPTGWGLYEPVTEPWNARALTRYLTRFPTSRLVAVAGEDRRAMSGVVTTTRHDDASVIQTSLAADLDQEAVQVLGQQLPRTLGRSSSPPQLVVASLRPPDPIENDRRRGTDPRSSAGSPQQPMTTRTCASTPTRSPTRSPEPRPSAGGTDPTGRSRPPTSSPGGNLTLMRLDRSARRHINSIRVSSTLVSVERR